MSCVVPEQRLVTAWARAYRDAGLWSGIALGDAFARTVARRRDATALIEDGGTLSYAELAARVDALAAGLARRGVTAGDAVAYMLPNWWEALPERQRLNTGLTGQATRPTLRQRFHGCAKRFMASGP